MFKRLVMTGLLVLTATMAAPGWAEEVAAQADVVQTAATVTINKGDNTWLMLAAILVILMSVPGLALFYGGLCLLYTSPSPRDATLSRMPSSA